MRESMNSVECVLRQLLFPYLCWAILPFVNELLSLQLIFRFVNIFTDCADLLFLQVWVVGLQCCTRPSRPNFVNTNFWSVSKHGFLKEKSEDTSVFTKWHLMHFLKSTGFLHQISPSFSLLPFPYLYSTFSWEIFSFLYFYAVFALWHFLSQVPRIFEQFLYTYMKDYIIRRSLVPYWETKPSNYIEGWMSVSSLQSWLLSIHSVYYRTFHLSDSRLLVTANRQVRGGW